MDIQQLIGNTLRWGVILACLLASIGGIYYLLQHGLDTVPDYRHFDVVSAAAQSNITTFNGLWQGSLCLTSSWNKIGSMWRLPRWC